jgi:hypothetical protein
MSSKRQCMSVIPDPNPPQPPGSPDPVPTPPPKPSVPPIPPQPPDPTPPEKLKGEQLWQSSVSRSMIACLVYPSQEESPFSPTLSSRQDNDLVRRSDGREALETVTYISAAKCWERPAARSRKPSWQSSTAITRTSTFIGCIWTAATQPSTVSGLTVIGADGSLSSAPSARCHTSTALCTCTSKRHSLCVDGAKACRG